VLVQDGLEWLHTSARWCPSTSTPSFTSAMQTDAADRLLGVEPMTLAERVALFERRALIRILRKANGNVANAARLAGHNRTNFYRLLQRHGLDPSAFRTTM